MNDILNRGVQKGLKRVHNQLYLIYSTIHFFFSVLGSILSGLYCSTV